MPRIKPRKTASLAVRHHTPRRVWLVRILLVVLFIAIALASFEFGRYRAGYNVLETSNTISTLQNDLAQAQADNERLREKVALLEQSRQIDRRAREQVQTRLAAVQDDILELREELAFYRGIVSPQDSESGLKIQNFSLAPGNQAGQYQFELVLIQSIKHDEKVSGEAKIIFHGSRDGEPVSLPLSELMADKRSLNFGFKYFQDFVGTVTLPADFLPHQVEVVAQPGNDDTVRETYDWKTLIKS